MEYSNELLDFWVGRSVFVSLQEGPDLSLEEMEKALKEPGWGVNKSMVSSRTAVYDLLGYDNLGITIKSEEGGAHVFTPWSAVLAIQGLLPEDDDL